MKIFKLFDVRSALTHRVAGLACLLAVAMTASVAQARPGVGDTFDSDGALVGKTGGYTHDGGKWDSAWTGSNGVFNVQKGLVTVGTLSGLQTVDRQYDIASPAGKTQFFSVEITPQAGATVYDVGLGFGSNLKIGIKDGQFFADLNGTVQTGGTAVANKPYVLTGSVQFNAAGNEVLTLWVNKTYSAYSAGGQHTLQVSAELGAMSIDKNVKLYANGSASAGKATFDDLYISTSYHAVTATRFQFASTTAQLQDGFEKFDTGSTGLKAGGIQKNFAVVGIARKDTNGNLLEAKVAVTNAGNAAGNVNVFETAGEVAGVAADLKTGGIKSVDGNGLRVRMENLFAGTNFSLKTYHHDSDADLGTMNIYDATGTTLLASVNASTGLLETPAHASFTLMSDENGVLEFVVKNANGTDVAVLNGVAAVPEPSTYALMGLGLVALVGVGIHRRRKAALLA